MGYQELFNNYFVELNNVTELLNKYVNAYRLLIGGKSLARRAINHSSFCPISFGW